MILVALLFGIIAIYWTAIIWKGRKELGRGNLILCLIVATMLYFVALFTILEM